MWARQHAAAALSSAPTLALAEQKMLGDQGYTTSLSGAFWAVKQGPRAVPLLEKMLGQIALYERRAEQGGGEIGAFPFNAIWALGRIPGDASASALTRFIATEKSAERRRLAEYALKAHRLRSQKQSTAYGVFGDSPMNNLYAAPSERAESLRILQPGQAVRVVRERVANPKEEGPRGGPTEFDLVELVPGGERGYVERVGDAFSPFY